MIAIFLSLPAWGDLFRRRARSGARSPLQILWHHVTDARPHLRTRTPVPRPSVRITGRSVCATCTADTAGRPYRFGARRHFGVVERSLVMTLCHPDPSTRAIRARIRVRRASAASAERRCPGARAATGALRRLLKRDRINSALSARTPLAKFSGPTPAAKALSRHRQMSAMSVSLDRTLVARPLSTRALTSSAKGNSHSSISPLRRRKS
jgi:hypothetical protein